jgi:phage gpG-like protein
MIDLRIKDLFFDRQVVLRAAGKAKREVLSKAGAFIRQTARTSIRKRKGTSKPGRPPYSHTGLLRRWILFGYDRNHDSVVVGPVGFKRSKAPNVLEFGGVANRPRWWRRRRNLSRKLRVRARPFMGPALEKERDKLPALWAGSVRGN